MGDIDLKNPCCLVVCDPCYVPERVDLDQLVEDAARLGRSRSIEMNGYSLGCVTPAAPGRWRVDNFMTTDDNLGLRLLRIA